MLRIHWKYKGGVLRSINSSIFLHVQPASFQENGCVVRVSLFVRIYVVALKILFRLRCSIHQKFGKKSLITIKCQQIVAFAPILFVLENTWCGFTTRWRLHSGWPTNNVWVNCMIDMTEFLVVSRSIFPLSPESNVKLIAKYVILRYQLHWF